MHYLKGEGLKAYSESDSVKNIIQKEIGAKNHTI